ncbi:MAG: hypothetical protein B7Y10_06345 [Sphingomonadales bacterium 24-56-14]|nr:MAG: hypothetical protein B7Y10_06345 [Sphingomonadales bacterium 24-56-14]
MPLLFDKKMLRADKTSETEKGRWNDPTALKHGSAVGCAAAGSCFHAVTGIADIIGGRSPERNSPTS